jgi:hypothetical protein
MLDAAPKAQAHFHPCDTPGPTTFLEGEQRTVRLEVGRAEFLKILDSLKEEAADKYKDVPMTGTLHAYLVCPSSVECPQLPPLGGETFPGYTIFKWQMTPKATGDFVLIWRLAAVLSKDRDVPVLDGEEKIAVRWSWSYSWRKFRDEKGFDVGWGLACGAVWECSYLGFLESSARRREIVPPKVEIQIAIKAGPEILKV